MAELTNATKFSGCINNSPVIFYYESAVFLLFFFLIYLQSLIMPDRQSLHLHLLEKLMVSLLEPHHVGRISVSGNCCSRFIFYRILLDKQAKEVHARVSLLYALWLSPLSQCFFSLPSPANVLGSLVLEKEESSNSRVACLCVSFAHLNIKEVLRGHRVCPPYQAGQSDTDLVVQVQLM